MRVKIIQCCIVFIIGFILLSGFVDSALANTTTPQNDLRAQYSEQVQAFAGEDGAKLGAPRDPRVIVAGMIKIFLSIVALIAVIYIIYGGYLYLTSGGEAERIENGKKIIFNSVIGLLIVLLSHSITYAAYRMIYEGAINPYGTMWSPAPGSYFQYEMLPDNSQLYSNDPFNK